MCWFSTFISSRPMPTVSRMWRSRRSRIGNRALHQVLRRVLDIYARALSSCTYILSMTKVFSALVISCRPVKLANVGKEPPGVQCSA